MPLQYFPRAGQVLVCDFKGFKPPEMVKCRPVIIISPKLPFRSQIATVVPISTTEPIKEVPFVVRLSKNYHPNEKDEKPCWAKCDMVMNISTSRLDGFKVGRRKFASPHCNEEDFNAVRIGVIHALGINDLIKE